MCQWMEGKKGTYDVAHVVVDPDVVVLWIEVWELCNTKKRPE